MAKLKDKADEIQRKVEVLNYPVAVIVYCNAGGGVVGYKIYREEK